MGQQTALQELLKFIESNDAFQIEDAYKKAKDLLERERSIVIEAYNQGYRDGEIDAASPTYNGDISEFTNAESYFKDNYTNQ